MRLWLLLAAALFSSSPVRAAGGDDAWDWYTGMTPFEQCEEYLLGDPYIETVLAEDLSGCAEVFGLPQVIEP